MGTQGIDNAYNADEILCACLLNARATAEYLKRKELNRVSLVCMGLEGKCEKEEDTLCAEYIKSILTGEEKDITEEISRLRYTSGSKFFDEKQADVFPEKDFYMCTELNKFRFALKYNGKTGVMERVDI